MIHKTCASQMFVTLVLDMKSIVSTLLLIFSFSFDVNSNPVKIDENVIPRYKPLEHPNYLFGDIVISKNQPKGLRNALALDDFLWPNGVVPIVIHTDLDSHKDLIVSALNHFHEKTCIRFKPRTDETDFVHIIYDDGCYSSIGRTGGSQAMSLGDGCYCKGTIIHELMHVLGFYHEQNRSDRDDFVHVIYDKIIEKSRHEFVKLDENMNRLYTPYDYESIMHYAKDAFSVDGSDTMVPVKKNVLLTHPCFKSGLSDFDIMKISKLYEC